MQLSELLEKGPVVLAFHRGHWCPYCRLNMSGLADIQTQLGRVQIVAISAEVQAYTRRLRTEARATFPFLSDVRVRHSWTEKTATLTLVVRRAVAAATRHGKPAGFLGDDGTVFVAPEGAFILSGPSIEVAGASEAELAALAREWPELSAVGAFVTPLMSMTYRSREDGWLARLDGGIVIQWGRLEWTREKLSRLSEAVADARLKEPGAYSADLRWFEDGKVLLKRTGKL